MAGDLKSRNLAIVREKENKQKKLTKIHDHTDRSGTYSHRIFYILFIAVVFPFQNFFKIHDFNGVYEYNNMFTRLLNCSIN